MKQKIVFLIILGLIIQPVLAKEGHMNILAAKETGSGYEGSPADLYLEIKEGTGRVFLDTFPLTKIDTQISTRFSKQIACDYLDISCDNFDFIYTIRANAPIIGGPSAGAAITALTVAMLEDLKIDESVAVTGTINSGGLIGPVGGLKEKITAAKEAGLKKVLIPKGSRYSKENNQSGNATLQNNTALNTTIDLVEYGNKIGIEVKEVSTLAEVVYGFTGTGIKETDGSLVIDERYKDTMRLLAISLCNLTNKFNEEFNNFKFPNESKTNVSFSIAKNLTSKGNEEFDNKQYYSSASYCFGANVRFRYLSLSLRNMTAKDIYNAINDIKKKNDQLDKKINEKEKNTITDLESYMVVKERLTESKKYLDESWAELNNTEKALSNLAYAIERLNSAYSWTKFSDSRGRKYILNKKVLKDSCQTKLSEAEERLEYFKIYFPTLLEDTTKEIKAAYEELNNGNYEMCLFKASQAKASVDAVLSVWGVDDENVKEILEQKLDVAKKVIIKEINKDIFPILGYSYYEYANTLKEEDKFSALLYAEYALELSKLDIYFEEKDRLKNNQDNKKDYKNFAVIFVLGLVLGFVFGYLIFYKRKQKFKNKVKKHKKENKKKKKKKLNIKFS